VRAFLVFLTVALSQLAVSVAFADELLLVRIVSMDREAGSVTGEIVEGPDLQPEGPEQGGRPPSGHDGGAGERGLIRLAVSSPLPADLHPGSLVRVGGTVSKETGSVAVTKLFPAGTEGRGGDPTGVRRRLENSRGTQGKGGGGRGYGRN
jgi:hypothetical protein